MLGAYFYIFSYLTFSWLRRPFWYDLYRYNLQNRVFYFKHGVVAVELAPKHSEEWVKEHRAWHNIPLVEQDKMYAFVNTVAKPTLKKIIRFSIWLIGRIISKIIAFFDFFWIKIKKRIKKKL